MKAALKKLAGARGFTLAETLICMLILLMVAGIVGGAIPAASKAFTKAVDASNAQVLLSTAITVIRNELSTATNVEVSSDGSYVTYNSGTTGSPSMICKQDGKVEIWTWYGYEITRNSETKEPANPSATRPVVSDQAVTKNLYLDYSKFVEGNGSIELQGLAVMMKSMVAEDKKVAGRDSMLIRLVAVMPTEEP